MRLRTEANGTSTALLSSVSKGRVFTVVECCADLLTVVAPVFMGNPIREVEHDRHQRQGRRDMVFNFPSHIHARPPPLPAEDSTKA